MKRIMPIICAILIAGLLVTQNLVSLAQAVYTDDFNDNTMDTAHWRLMDDGTGVSVAEVNQRLEVTIASTTKANPGARMFIAGYTSVCRIRGDFDMQVDYQLLDWPAANGIKVGLGSGLGAVERVSFVPGDNPGVQREVYLADFNASSQGTIATTDLGGKLRMVRTGNTISGYYFKDGNWVLLTTQPVTTLDIHYSLGAWGYDAAFSQKTVKLAFDNFALNQGSLLCGSAAASDPESFAVADDFRDYYHRYDGLRTLGGGISARLIRNGYPSQYFEKAVLEDHLSDPGIKPNSIDRYQYGLLVDELQQAHSRLPVGGDTSNVTYETLAQLADPSLRVAPPSGYPGSGVYMLADGNVFVPFTADLHGAPGQLVLGSFWAYINNPDLFPRGWLRDVGLPISGAFYAHVTKNFPTGKAERVIIVQAFQRTIITYDPLNPQGWQIERANIGTDYFKAFPQRLQ